MTDVHDLSAFTAQQADAIRADGNVLVQAGAGTGKTRTLVERCARKVLHEGIGLDQILMVTFTDAAAAEMRQRIRERLEQAQHEKSSARVAEQLALLETASICTLHSFCLQLVRQHFYELQLDPQLTVLSEQQSRVLQEETLDAIFQEVYAGSHKRAEAIAALIGMLSYERKLRELIYKAHEYTQARPDPQVWFARELAKLEKPNVAMWERWLFEGATELRETWLPLLEADALLCPQLARCAQVLKDVPESREELVHMLERIRNIDEDDWQGQITLFRKPVKVFFEDAEFLRSVATVTQGDPLLQDWEWSAPQLRAFLELAREFAERFAAAKRASGSLDFQDLEQFSLRLLWDGQQPTPLALEWQRRLELVFVDEYQDINPAQDLILRALSKSDRGELNRFLVGDVKQSIYGFRQAEPSIFLEYARRWKKEGAMFPLSENFRSREGLLDFINSLFSQIMQPELGGIDYQAEGQLGFADRQKRKNLSREHDSHPRAEFVLCLTDTDDSNEDDRSKAEREARVIALRLKELHGEVIWDERGKKQRPVEWRDMVILLRAAKGKVEAYAKEFDKAGVPLLASAGSLYEALEVQDLLNLLQVLDNPLQDRPLVAVLRSPLAGLSPDDLAQIRLAKRDVPFWNALELWHISVSARGGPRSINENKQMELFNAANVPASSESEALAFRKIDAFLARFRRWRVLARSSSLTERVERVLEETNYLDWLTTQSRPEQRRANVQQLLSLTREFDDLHRQNLYSFLQFLKNEQEAGAERDPPPTAASDAVRLMTIHKSKGLEFPVVVLPDLGKPFNTTDAAGEIILDPELGLCARVHPPETGQTYPSLPLWLARKRLNAKGLAEELRLLYVAMTRAQEMLILSGSCSKKRAQNWATRKGDYMQPHRLRRAKSGLDWLGPWLSSIAPADWLDQPQGTTEHWRWRIVTPGSLDMPAVASAPVAELAGVDAADPRSEAVSAKDLEELQARLGWSYPNSAATEQAAKSSVTALRREAAEELTTPFETRRFAAPRGLEAASPKAGNFDAAEIGLAHHQFLQWLDLSRATEPDALAEEVARLVKTKLLAPEQAAALDLPAIARFWQSETGREILKHTENIRREVPFTVRLDSKSDPSIPLLARIPEGEFIVVQGAIDLTVFLPNELWIVDFKTDQCKAEELEDKIHQYSIQLRLYALALAQIYANPVRRCWLHFLQPGRTVEIKLTDRSR